VTKYVGFLGVGREKPNMYHQSDKQANGKIKENKI